MRFASSLLLSAIAAASAAGAPLPPTPRQRADAATLWAAALANGTSAWSRLAYMTDTIGPRFSGSDGLSAALDYMAALAASDGLRVTREPVRVPVWVRGAEGASLVLPRAKALHFCGLGYSNSTPGGAPITADVLVVANNTELQARAAEARGKIILFDWPTWLGYGNTVGIRGAAAGYAAAVGGVGALIKSITPWGLQTCHTGMSAPAAVAAGAVSHEDALQMRRMQERGQRVVVTMQMSAAVQGTREHTQLLMDYVSPGAAHPEQMVIISGHADSWDLAEGAMDDGGGVMTAIEAMRLIASSGVRVDRTIRAIAWVDEEAGGVGAQQYLADFGAGFGNVSFAMESDTGAFQPYGLSYVGGASGLAQLQALAPLLEATGATNVTAGGDDTDEAVLCAAGVPCAAIWPYDPRAAQADNNPCKDFAAQPALPPHMPFSVSDGYMFLHHTSSDTVDKLDPLQLQTVAAVNAIWAVSVANLPFMLPRD